MIFVDTSALFATLAKDQSVHPAAATTWRKLVVSREQLVTTNYAVVELLSLVQRRMGLDAVRDVEAVIIPLLEMAWIDQQLHDRAITALLAANRRDVSLVDYVSFEFMRSRGLRTAFAFDRHFHDYGFQTVP